MLPTKGYFQDIECPFNNTSCGRPYCHFRHKRRPTENVEENLQETSKNTIPTYKPTPKSELANIHSKSHIPISYVPDLAFKRERLVRPAPKIEKPTYKPTPLSILSSANKFGTDLPDNHEHIEAIKDVQENIASNVYDPLQSEINFEDLSSEFDQIDDIINNSEAELQTSTGATEPQELINEDLAKLKSDIEREQNRLNLLKSGLSSSSLEGGISSDFQEIHIKKEVEDDGYVLNDKDTVIEVPKINIKQEKVDDLVPIKIEKEIIENKKQPKKSEKNNKSSRKDLSRDKVKIEKTPSKDSSKIKKTSEKTTNKEKHSNSKEKSSKDSSKDRNINKEHLKSKERAVELSEKSSKPHKSSEREKHRKEEKKNSSRKKSKEKEKDKRKHKSREKTQVKAKKKSRRKSSSSSSSSYESSISSESSSEREKDRHRHKRDKKRSSSRKHKSRDRSRSSTRHKSKHKEKYKKSGDISLSRSRSRSVSTSKEKSKTSRKRSRSVSKEKDKKPSKEKEKNKDKNKEKERHKSISSKEKRKESSKNFTNKREKSSSIEKRKKSTSESASSINDNYDQNNDAQDSDNHLPMEELVPSDIDLDLEDEDETMRECFKIFNEYKPEAVRRPPITKIIEPPSSTNLIEEEYTPYVGKKRTAHAGAETVTVCSKLVPTVTAQPKAIPTPGQTLSDRYRLAKMAQASNEQEDIINEVKKMTQQPIKRPATTLLEAARQHKIKRMKEQMLKEKEKKLPSTNVVDDILNGVHKSSQPQVKLQPKKIAAVPNAALIEKAKERISLIKQHREQPAKTVAQNTKSARVAHVPEFSLSDIPDVLQADKSKLPVNVRTRFLTMIADECSKLYATKQDAFTRALNEEFSCYEKCKVLATYRNSAMLAVNRLRKEIQDRESKGLGPLLSGEKGPTGKESDFNGQRFYDHVKRWLLTEEELDIHGYPKESEQRGRAIIINRKAVDYSMIDENQRKCSRCSKIYQVDDDGWPLFEEECMYHPLKKRTIRGEHIFLCCKSSDDTGCASSDTHVFDGLDKHLLEGYQKTLPPEIENDPRSVAVYALDCEMCYTTKGLELTRVTIVDTECKTVYESLVKPLNPIIDYNTRFSGITKEQMDRTSTNILQIQANILHLCNSETILVGHSLESDLKALKIIHGTIIDTSVLFPHKMGLPHKRALRVLASEYLKKIIQNDVSGHDSAEDAVTCMELIKWKLKEELKTRTK